MKEATEITQEPTFSSIDEVRSVEETFEELCNFIFGADETPTLDQILDDLQIIE